MRKLLLILLVAAALVIGLGFYLDWFSLALTDGDKQITVSVTIDKEKIKSDLGKAKEETKDKAGGENNEKTKGSAPTVRAKE